MQANLDIHDEDLKKFVDFQIEQGVQGIVPCGTTGESATMSHAEHKHVIDIVVNQAKGRVPVVAGSGSNSTKEAIDLTKHAESAGADAALLITPYYNKPTQRGLIYHFEKIAEAVSLPLVLYNVPGRTGVNMLPETTIKLSKIKNIVAVKEASGSISQIQQIIAGTRDNPDFCVLSGDDSLTYSIVMLGGTGVISVASNIAPGLMGEFGQKIIDKDTLGARELHFKLLKLFKVIFIETNPIPSKAAARLMNLGGIYNWYLRPPLIDPTPEHLEEIKKVLKSLQLL